MKLYGSSIAVVATALALAACMPAPPVAQSKENLLTAAGFKQITLNTPAKQAAFKALPAHAQDLQGQDRLGIPRPRHVRLPLYRQPERL